MRPLWVIRWVMVALSAALAFFLIARGNVVIGVLIGALAACRVAMLLTWMKRRRTFRERFPHGVGNRPRGGGNW